MNHRPEEVSGTLKLSTKPFKIGSRRYVAEHGTLMVPENRRKADSRSISIPILRIRAANDQRAEPIFWLEGGPGSSNLKFRPPAWLLAKHDIVTPGPHGASTYVTGPNPTALPHGDGVSSSPKPTSIGPR